MSGIAKKYNTSVDELMKANDISDPNQIFVGQELKIPGIQQPSDDAKPAVQKVPQLRWATTQGPVAPYSYHEHMNNAQQEYGVMPLAEIAI